MPLLEHIEQKSLMGRQVWILRTTKGKIIFAKYFRGELTCRYDNEFSGVQFFISKWPRNAPQVLTTQEMLKVSKFKLEHVLPPLNEAEVKHIEHTIEGQPSL